MALNQGAIEIAVFLLDDFSTPVTGNLVEQNNFFISYHASASSIEVSPSDSTQSVNSTWGLFPILLAQQATNVAGAALFDSISFSGDNNSTTTIAFELISNGALNVQGTSCSILLNGCEGNYEVKQSDAGVDSCVLRAYYFVPYTTY